MESWLKKSNDNGNKPTADDVEVAVKANADRVFANVLVFCTNMYICIGFGYQCLVIIFCS